MDSYKPFRKLDQIAPKIGFSRIVSFASETDVPGTVEHCERGNALETKAIMNFGFGVKGKRDASTDTIKMQSAETLFTPSQMLP